MPVRKEKSFQMSSASILRNYKYKRKLSPLSKRRNNKDQEMNEEENNNKRNSRKSQCNSTLVL